jgi:DNA repair protein RadD
VKTLRYYQNEAVDDSFEFFSESDGNGLIVCPTGAGKSLIIAEFIRRIFASYANSRVIVVAHVAELLTQNEAELKDIWPEAETSFWSASIGEKKHSRIMFAGIASVYKNAAQMGEVDFLIVDEAHLIPSKGFGMYQRFIQELRSYNPMLRVLGASATPFRLDHGLLVDGGHVFTHHCYEVDLRKLVEQKFLSPLRPKKPDGQIDMRGVHIKNHEFASGEMEAAAMRVVDAALNEVCTFGKDRRSWMLFCSGVSHAKAVTDLLVKRGISTRMVTGETPKAERKDIVNSFSKGEFTALVNVNVFTTGFNVSRVDMIALLRATLSASLYVQMLGRGMRLADGKEDCLVLDFGGNIERHGPIDQVRVRKPGEKEDGVAPMKVCETCDALCATACRVCPDCGAPFPINDDPAHDHTAAVKTLMSWEKVRDVRTLDVTGVGYASHVGKSGKPSLRVSYLCGLQPVSEYVCIGHGGFAGQKAIQWWRERNPNGAVPETVGGALANTSALIKPEQIRVDFSEKYPRILHHVMPQPPITSARLQTQAFIKSQKIGAQAVKEIIRKYGAETIGMLPKEHYESLYKELAA